jgi:hypothetical protein
VFGALLPNGSFSECVPQYSAGWATSMAVTRHTSDIVYANENGSILSVTNLSPPTTYNVQPSELLFAYNATFNNHSALSLGTVISSAEGMGIADETTAIKAFLVLPFLLFQPMSVWLSQKDYPSTNEATWSSGWAISRIMIQKWTVITFASIVVSVYLWCMGCLFWVGRRQSPPVTQFPLLDFASRIASGKDIIQVALSDAPLRGGFRQTLQEKELFLGNIFKVYQELSEPSTPLPNARSITANKDESHTDENIEDPNVLRTGNDPLARSGLIVEKELGGGESRPTETELQEGGTIGATRGGMDMGVASSLLEGYLQEGGRIGFAFEGKDVRLLKRIKP